MAIRKSSPVWMLILVALIGTAVALFATTNGIGVTTDSVIYIGYARSVAGGKGLMAPSITGEITPLSYYPPLYPFVLGMIGRADGDPVRGARWLSAFLLGANVLLIGHFIRRCVSGSTWAPVLGAILTLSALGVLQTHLIALSEPLFFVTAFLGLLLLAEHLEKPRWGFLAASAALTAVALLTRYVGLAVLLAGIVGIALLSRKPLKRTALDCAIFLVISALPMAFWSLHNVHTLGKPVNASLSFHPVTMDDLDSGRITMKRWIFPRKLPGIIKGINYASVAGALAMLILIWRRRKRAVYAAGAVPEDPAAHLRLMAIFAVVYLAFLVIVISFLNALTPLDWRLLVPVFLSLVILIVSGGARFLRVLPEHDHLRTAAAVICVGFLFVYVFDGTRYVIRGHNEGILYNNFTWRNSEIIRLVRELPPGTSIFTNAPDAIQFLAERNARQLPAKMNPVTRQFHGDYLSRLDRLGAELEKSHGVLVFFNKIERYFLPAESEVVERLPLRLVAAAEEGSVYTIQERSP